MKIPQDCSWTWRKLLQQREKIKQYMGMKIGDGRKCSLFYDIWLGAEALCDKLSVLIGGIMRGLHNGFQMVYGVFR